METINKRLINSEATGAALLFGLISGGYDLLSPLLPKLPSALGNILSIVLWAAKLVGCIALMNYFMKRLRSRYEDVDRSSLLHYGTLIALYSAIITAVCSYVSTQYIYPNMISDSLQMLESYVDSNTRTALSEVEGRFPIISLVSNLIWCFLYGWALSGILSARIASADMFAGSNNNKDDDDDYI